MDYVKKIIEYCDKRIEQENRMIMIIENPFADEIDWSRNFRYIYVNFPEEKLPSPCLYYNSLDKKLQIYEDEYFYEVEEYLNKKTISFD